MVAFAGFIGGMFSFGSAAAGTLFSAAAGIGAGGAFYAGASTGRVMFSSATSPSVSAPVPKPLSRTATRNRLFS